MATPTEIRPGIYDWSTLHQAGSDDLYKPAKDDEWKNFRFSDQQVKQFWRDGYVSNIRVLTPEQCDRIIADYGYFTMKVVRLASTDGLCTSCMYEPLQGELPQHPGHDLLYEYFSNQTGDPDNVLIHVLGQWRLTALFHDLVFHPKIVVPASQLLEENSERPVRFWHDQLFCKPAKHGGNIAWHQDYSYWTRTKPCRHLTVHIALDAQTVENGVLQYIPGSHRWTRNGGEPFPILDRNFKDMEGLQGILTEEEKAAFKPVPAMLKKGEASFHSSLSVHGSYGNRSDAPRRAAVLNYFSDGVVSDTDGLMLTAVQDKNPTNFKGADIPKGQKMEGQFYPLVYDPGWAK